MGITINIKQSVIEETQKEINNSNTTIANLIDLQYMPFTEFTLKVMHEITYELALAVVTEEMGDNVDIFTRTKCASDLAKAYNNSSESINFKLTKDALYVNSKELTMKVFQKDGTIEFNTDAPVSCEVNILSKEILDEIDKLNGDLNKQAYVNKICLDQMALLQCVIAIFNKENKYNIVEKETIKPIKKKNKSSKKNKSKNITYIKHKDITINKYIRDTNTISQGDRKYERHTESWFQRGHWRRYKSGKKIWIKECVKGGHNKKINKTYEIK